MLIEIALFREGLFSFEVTQLDIQVPLVFHPGPNPAPSGLAKFTALSASVVSSAK